MIRSLGSVGDLISNVREAWPRWSGCCSISPPTCSGRSAPTASRPNGGRPCATCNRSRSNAGFLNTKISFILEATLGLVSIEQNKIIKLFSVMSVVMMPPTLIASIYGMNFKRFLPRTGVGIRLSDRPDHDGRAAAVPFLYFKRKKWL